MCVLTEIFLAMLFIIFFLKSFAYFDEGFMVNIPSLQLNVI